MPWSNPNTAGNINMGMQAISGIGNALFPNSYDPKVGMERPNPFKTFSNFQMAGMGAQFGPAGLAVGAGVDVIKNAIAYQKAQNAYHTAQNKQQYYDARGNRQANMMPDYTGMAKYGGMYDNGGMVPINVEQNEAFVQQQPNGQYQMLGMTPSTTPSHDMGGMNLSVPQGTMVFPQGYVPDMQNAMSNPQDMAQLQWQMLQQAQGQAMNGAPYSNGMTIGQDGLMADAPPSNLMAQLQFNPQTPNYPQQTPMLNNANEEVAEEQEIEVPKGQPIQQKDMRTITRQAAMRSGVYKDAQGRAATYWDEKTQTRYFKDGTPFQLGKNYSPTNPVKNNQEYNKSVQEPDIFKNPTFGGQGNISKEEFEDNGIPTVSESQLKQWESEYAANDPNSLANQQAYQKGNKNLQTVLTEGFEQAAKQKQGYPKGQEKLLSDYEYLAGRKLDTEALNMPKSKVSSDYQYTSDEGYLSEKAGFPKTKTQQEGEIESITRTLSMPNIGKDTKAALEYRLSQLKMQQTRPSAGTELGNLAKSAKGGMPVPSGKSKATMTDKAISLGDPRDPEMSNPNSQKYKAAGYEWSSNLHRWLYTFDTMQDRAGNKFPSTIGVNHAVNRGGSTGNPKK